MSDDIEEIMEGGLDEFHGVKHIKFCLEYLEKNGFKSAVVLACVDNPENAFAGNCFGDDEDLLTMANAFIDCKERDIDAGFET